MSEPEKQQRIGAFEGAPYESRAWSLRDLSVKTFHMRTCPVQFSFT